MKKRFTEEQIIGFLWEAETGLPVVELCRQHGFSDYLWRRSLRYERVRCQMLQRAGNLERTTQKAAGRCAA